jgi:hypothetical protein
MDSSKTRLTSQGVRDLNYYGPRPKKAVKVEPAPESAAETPPASIEDVAAPASDPP